MLRFLRLLSWLVAAVVLVLLTSCTPREAGDTATATPAPSRTDSLAARAISVPLLTDFYTADPSAHVFDGRLYVYPSHDIETDLEMNDDGAQFAMRDYRVLSMDRPDGEVTAHDVALRLEDIPWASRQLWAPDAAERNGTYYLYFPARDRDGRFRVGVAVGEEPAGPFTPDPEPITGAYSIDPAVFVDTDGSYFLYLGGIMGGQLQKYRDNTYGESNEEPAADQPALRPVVARLDTSMRQLAEAPRPVDILDENGQPLLAGDHDRRFFEGAWVHHHADRYYLSYSTGDTHYLVYATGDSPYGPFTYRGRILEPVEGWTTHHSIVEWQGKWYLFYHDSLLSGGQTHLRSVKMTELEYTPEGDIKTITPYGAKS